MKTNSKYLRLQFEKETQNKHITEALGRYNPVYVEWLEKRNEELIDTIDKILYHKQT